MITLALSKSFQTFKYRVCTYLGSGCNGGVIFFEVIFRPAFVGHIPISSLFVVSYSHSEKENRMHGCLRSPCICVAHHDNDTQSQNSPHLGTHTFTPIHRRAPHRLAGLRPETRDALWFLAKEEGGGGDLTMNTRNNGPFCQLKFCPL